MGSEVWACPEVPVSSLGSFSFLIFNCTQYDRLALQSQRLLAVDPVAVSYVLQNSDSFQKSEFLRFSLGVFIGKGMHNSQFRGLILTQFDIS
jgi:hypothetical protein